MMTMRPSPHPDSGTPPLGASHVLDPCDQVPWNSSFIGSFAGLVECLGCAARGLGRELQRAFELDRFCVGVRGGVARLLVRRGVGDR